MDAPSEPSVQVSDERVIDFDDALARVFGKVKAAPKDGIDRNTMKDGRPRRYSTLAAVYDACREALDAEGFAYPQWPSADEDGAIWVETHLRRKGVALIRRLRFPLQGQMMKGGQDFRPVTIQDMGKAITYARRYSLTAMLGIVSDEDDDGHSASKPEPASQPDPVWDAFVQARTELMRARGLSEAAAYQAAKDAAGLTFPDGQAETDAQLHAMTEAARKLAAEKPRAKPKSKAKPKAKAAELPSWIDGDDHAQAFTLWRGAGAALVEHRSADYRDAHGEEPGADLVAAFRADVLGICARTAKVERFDPKTAGTEGLTLAADALTQELERRKACR